MIVIDDNDCVVFTPKQKACPSWPVRVQGMQGLWRYIGPADGDPFIGTNIVEVIGPYFPSNPERNGGRSRVFSADKLKYAGKSAKPVDVRDIGMEDISLRAQRRR